MADPESHPLSEEELDRRIAAALKMRSTRPGPWTPDCLAPPRLWSAASGTARLQGHERSHLSNCERCAANFSEIRGAMATRAADVSAVAPLSAPSTEDGPAIPGPERQDRRSARGRRRPGSLIAAAIRWLASWKERLGRSWVRVMATPRYAVLVIVVLLLAGAMGKATWDDMIRTRRDLPTDNYIRWALDGEEFPSTDPDKAKVLMVAEDGRAWIRGTADPYSIQAIRFDVGPDLPGDFAGTLPISDEPRRAARVAFQRHFRIPRDGVMRKVRIQLVPHEKAKQAEPHLFGDESKLTYTRYVLRTADGSVKLYSELPEQLRLAWSNDGLMELECTWENMPADQATLALWFANDHWAYWQADLHEDSGALERAVSEGMTEVLVARYPQAGPVTEVPDTASIKSGVPVPRGVFDKPTALQRIPERPRADPTADGGPGAAGEGDERAVSPKVEITKLEPQSEGLWIAEGTHRDLLDGEQLWPFLQDQSGRRYLQAPSLTLLDDGSWFHENIRPADANVRVLLIVHVNELGARLLKQWVKEHRFGALSDEEFNDIPGYGVVAKERFPAP